MHSNPQRGNILFLILLAIILFVALSYAVTSGMRGGGNNAARESAQSGAAAILQYMTLVRSTVERLRVVNGCDWNNLDMRSSLFVRVNGTAIDSTSPPFAPKAGCAVFQEYGGPLAVQTFEKYAAPGMIDWLTANNTVAWYPGAMAVRWVSRINEGTDGPEVAIMFDNMSVDVCRYAINMASPPSALSGETIDHSANMQNSPPTISGTNRIDEAVNLGGDVFAIQAAAANLPYCRMGMILWPR